MAEHITVIEKKNIHAATVKKLGREPKMKNDPENPNPKKIRFLSKIKGLNLFKDSHYIIQFSAGVYETDLPVDIKFLREHEAFGKEYWENEFPKEVLDKFNQDKALIFKTEDIFQIPEAGY